MSKAKNSLKDPFPIDQLKDMDLGHADGHRDRKIEQAFIKTRAVNQFIQDRHSIVIGPYGAGKSSLFKLLKNKSKILSVFESRLIIPIEEQIQFNELRSLSSQYFSNISDRLFYQLIWKLQVCKSISVSLSKLEGFPANQNEKYIDKFLKNVGVDLGETSITQSIKNMFSNVSFKIKAKISATPIEIEAGKEAKSASPTIEVNLDTVIIRIDEILKERGFSGALIIIDKLDKFVTHEDYETQRKFIEALLEVEDDFYSYERINFKIFLRSDLYQRLDLSSLGPDKVGDNTLRLCWSSQEILSFIAKRLIISLIEAEIVNIYEIAESTDRLDHQLRWYEKLLKSKEKEGALYRLAVFWSKTFSKKREISTFEKIEHAIIAIIFEDRLLHANSQGEMSKISAVEFFKTHFLDGNDTCTPRQILIFLKKVTEEAIEYYRKNPDLNSHTKPISVGWGWEVFNSEIVYSAYKASKKEYISNVSKVDEKWKKPFEDLLRKIESKKVIEHKWIAENIDLEGVDGNDVGFVSFLHVIGFLKIKENHTNYKKRKYSIPILYKEACLSE